MCSWKAMLRRRGSDEEERRVVETAAVWSAAVPDTEEEDCKHEDEEAEAEVRNYDGCDEHYAMLGSNQRCALLCIEKS